MSGFQIAILVVVGVLAIALLIWCVNQNPSDRDVDPPINEIDPPSGE